MRVHKCDVRTFCVGYIFLDDCSHDRSYTELRLVDETRQEMRSNYRIFIVRPLLNAQIPEHRPRAIISFSSLVIQTDNHDEFDA